jgi:L-lactate dehydrogenase complex protein LldF
MAAIGKMFASPKRYERAQRLAKLGRGPLAHLGGSVPILSGWTAMRDLPDIPDQTFRDWWRAR